VLIASVLPTLPVSDPVLIFAIAMIIFVSAPLLFERVRIPGIVGLIVTGVIVGPNALNVLERGATVQLLGAVGLLYLMFMVGLELDLHDFDKYRNRSVVFGLLSFAIPMALGTGLGVAFGYGIASSLLLGSVFASHTVLAYPIASRLGIVKNLAVTTTLGGTILTEILALLVLAVVAGSLEGGIGPAFWAELGLSLSVYVLAVLIGVPVLARWFFRNMRSDATVEFVFVMAVLFSVAYLAHAAQVEPIIGALLAGLAFNRLIPEQGTLMNRIHFMGNAFFIPFFLLSVGMLVDVRVLSTWDVWLFSVAVAVAVVMGKWLSARAMQAAFSYSSDEGWTIFGLSVPHASGTLAIVLVAFEIGVFDQVEVNGIVLTILLTSLIGPWVVGKYGRRLAISEEQKPYEPGEAPQRILIPISNPATEEALLDLAMLVRGKDSQEPLYPLMVVRDLEDRSEEQVAEAEKMLSHAVIYAAGADVPVAPLTRVDQNIAAGIARGVAETRTRTVVVGWDGGRARGAGVFGSVLDQLLELSRQMVIVAKLGHPLNTTKRVLVVVPSLAHRHPGFHEAVRSVKMIASQLGAPVVGLLVEGDPEKYETRFAKVKPAAPTEFHRLDGWSGVVPELRKRIQPSDTVVLLSARRGTLPWHPKLELLPRQLSRIGAESFLVIYPAEAESPRRWSTGAAALPTGLTPERTLYDLPKMPFERALRRIVSERLPPSVPKGEVIVQRLIKAEQEFSTEVRPGVVVPHARVSGLREPIVFLATSREGIDFPKAQEPAKLIFVLLSPDDEPQEHLRALAEIARLASSEGYVEELLKAGQRSAEDEPGVEGASPGESGS
jgi:Kef-type K+ transport system membrane component KefB/mannitol/fructose-specific phosphotransferase system IIA component